MRSFRQIRRGFRQLFARNAIEREMDEEIRIHLEMETAANLRKGMDPREARRQALIAFGGLERFKERAREERTLAGALDLGKDIRYALRTLRNRRTWTLSVVSTLGLGIGGCAAMLVVAWSVLVQPLPFPGSEGLIALRFRPVNEQAWEFLSTRPEVSGAHQGRYRTFAEFEDWRAVTEDVLETLAAVGEPSLTSVRVDGRVEDLYAVRASADFFRLLNVPAELGRWPTVEEDDPSGPAALLLGHGAWIDLFGGDPGVIGRSVTLGDVPHTIVGVMPSAFSLPGTDTQVWASMATASRRYNSWNYRMIGRLRSGVSIKQAALAIGARTVAARMLDGPPLIWGAEVRSLRSDTTESVRLPLLLLLSAAFTVLLIACLNVVNLMWSRTSEREGELQVRTILGATMGRLRRQILTEGAVLGLLGGLLGLGISLLLPDLLLSLAPTPIPRHEEVGLGPPVLVSSLLLSIGVGLAVSLIPAIRASSGRFRPGMIPRVTGGFLPELRSRMRDFLIVSQVALTMVLLVCGGLLLRNFLSLVTVERGFDPRDVLAFQVQLRTSTHPRPDERREVYDGILDRIASLPTVRSAAFVLYLPGSGQFHSVDFRISGDPTVSRDAWETERLEVTAGYFPTMGIPLIEGRGFEPGDRWAGQTEVVISESMARTYFADRSAVGSTLELDTGERVTVVGVAGDVRFRGSATEAHRLYLPFTEGRQNASGLVRLDEGGPLRVQEVLQATARSLGQEVGLSSLRPLPSFLSSSLREPKFRMVLLGAFALVALLLATVGVYGVMSCWITVRRGQFGVHQALGATPQSVISLILRRGLLLTLAGVAAGTIGSFWAVRLIGGYVTGVGVNDAPTFLSSAGFLLLLGLVASTIPARALVRYNLVQSLQGR